MFDSYRLWDSRAPPPGQSCPGQSSLRPGLRTESEPPWHTIRARVRPAGWDRDLPHVQLGIESDELEVRLSDVSRCHSPAFLWCHLYLPLSLNWDYLNSRVVCWSRAGWMTQHVTPVFPSGNLRRESSSSYYTALQRVGSPHQPNKSYNIDIFFKFKNYLVTSCFFFYEARFNTKYKTWKHYLPEAFRNVSLLIQLVTNIVTFLIWRKTKTDNQICKEFFETHSSSECQSDSMTDRSKYFHNRYQLN